MGKGFYFFPKLIRILLLIHLITKLFGKRGDTIVFTVTSNRFLGKWFVQ